MDKSGRPFKDNDQIVITESRTVSPEEARGYLQPTPCELAICTIGIAMKLH
jgi:hypothetical protein